MKKYYVKLLGIMICAILMTGCAFHFRSPKYFPSELKTLYFSPERPNSTLSQQLTALFRSMHAHLVKSSSQARFSVVVTRDHFEYSRPDIVDATLPSTLNFIQSAKINIIDNQSKQVIATREFATSQSLTLTANQMYTAYANNLIEEELNRQIVLVVYYWLTSHNMKDALHHAVITKTTRRAS